MSAAPVWITATPPTPNGELHLGHLAGPYVAADVLRRFLQAEGVPARLTTGLDDHQSYVPVAGLREGRTAGEVAAGYGAAIERAWTDAGIEFDRIVRPRDDEGYARYVRDFFATLVDRGAIVPRVRPLPWCGSCRRWLYEAYVAGRCPHCKAESGGNACEACGRPNDCGDLLDPVCVVCGGAGEPRDCQRLYFRLAPFTAELTRFWRDVRMPPHLRALCESMLADGLPDIAVSHPGDWGLPVPTPGFAGQRIYVWFEMAPGYLLQLPGDAPRPAPVQCFGFDNGYFHAVLFPTLYRAFDPAIALPAQFVVNEFYRLAGRKFSTSRRHAVWARAALGDAGADAVRYHVLHDRPNGRQTSFEPPDLQRSLRRLREHWNGWLERLFHTVAADCDGRVPPEPPAGPAWVLLRERVARIAGELREAYGPDSFDPRRAVALLDEVVALAADFGHVHAHERLRPGGGPALRAAVAAQLSVAAGLAAFAGPVLPFGAARLAGCLGVAAHRRIDAAALEPLPPGRPIQPPDAPLFGAAAPQPGTGS